MTERETAEAIDRRAAAWAARIDRAPLEPDEQQDLDLWLSQDARRLGAFARARAVAEHTRRAAALGTGEGGFDTSPTLSRRSVIAAGVAVGGVSLTGLAAASWRQAQRLETGRGEVRTVALDDGTTVSLNTLSRVSVRYTRTVREVVLMFGEALFTVAEDPQRPFLLRAAGERLTATTGAFLLKRLDQAPLEITALEGSIRMAGDKAALARLPANHLVRLGGGDLQITPVDADARGRMLAWREGKLEFRDESLARAAAEFGRYRGAPIRLADARVSALTITGLFEANDPAAFARAAARSLNLRAEIGPERILLSRA